jgi:polyisoprenoid-binding protein YceI
VRTATCAFRATSRSGNWRVGIAGTGAIDRADWGITWNNTLANGALAVGERVKLNLHVEAVLKV